MAKENNNYDDESFNPKMSRRNFVNYSGSCLVLGIPGVTSGQTFLSERRPVKSRIQVRKVDSNFEREPLYPYRFKGGVLKENWQTAAYLESSSGTSKVGLGTQGILWSDAKVYAEH
ncbi:MAG: hypothetical protein ABI687_13210, partial [Flavitalea sp.]